MRKCLVCDCEFDEWKAQLIPSSARGSILALDGGGVRGLIQLEILSCIEKKIGLDLPLMRFFDLIVGSSIGVSQNLKLSVVLLTVSQEES
jgi:patatin-like phospholipase/acyl hydrolase